MITDDEWRRRFLERIEAAGYPHKDVMQLVAATEVAELRDAMGDDPETAADRELVCWGDRPALQ